MTSLQSFSWALQSYPKLPLTDRQPGIPRIAYEATAIMLLLNNIFLSKFMRSHRGRSG